MENNKFTGENNKENKTPEIKLTKIEVSNSENNENIEVKDVIENTENTEVSPVNEVQESENLEAVDNELLDILNSTAITEDDTVEYDEEDDYEDDDDDYYIDRKGRRRRKKQHKGLKALILAFFIISISVGLAYFIIRIGTDITGINKNGDIVYVKIPQGASTEEIAGILKTNEIIESEWAFRIFSKLTHADGKYQFGSFELKPSYTYEGIIDILTAENNAVNVVNVTIPEGKTLNDIARILEEKQVCNGAEFIKAAEAFEGNYTFKEYIHVTGDIYYKSEGYLFPDTYSFYLDEDPASVAAKFFANFNNKFTDEMYARMNELGVSMNQLISLASLIQGESANDDQMGGISSVFWNRLNASANFPYLQSDVTTRYIEDDLKQVIDESKYEKYQSMFYSYDTYACIGLPSGPVNNPGLKAIEAALYPDQTDNLYFCHNIATGEIYYAKTLDQHNYNLYLAGLR